ncbi:EpsI family protein [Oleidesulfovibrio alaskensis G20]|jgi:EpsI family protein|uniref:EpsI family protein n=1 Tax=Oleidesulfovibrio alaskensis (strain ATCC BAA-1058 / DSM 17464 / G20) TaxID=207559 RepID=Q314J7_OLEA2|nr:exosortase C-terminal domain/associated protein EpsI [Oleidesulfovibrio alaskensis]ABB37649.1 EpsI family protein [Oleidesulfovibrio alaskensis G20]MBG0773570.1 EpsI family protein [Oleidesulfovibrio alaskensis]
MRARFCVVFALLALAAVFVHTHSTASAPPHRPLQEIPVSLGPWRLMGQTAFSTEVLDLLRPTDYLMRRYQDRSGVVVDLYVGYHGGAKGEGGIHSPRNCLPGSGWYELSSNPMVVRTSAGSVHLVRAEYAYGEMSTSFYYWFDVRGRSLTDEYALKWEQLVNGLLHGRKDASFIRISVPPHIPQPDEVATRFISDFYPVLNTFLPR